MRYLIYMRYFLDPIHFRPNVGREILARLLDPGSQMVPSRPDLAVELHVADLAERNRRFDANAELWRHANPDEVARIDSFAREKEKLAGVRVGQVLPAIPQNAACDNLPAKVAQ